MRFVPVRIATLCIALALAAGCSNNNPTTCENVTCAGVCCAAGQVCGADGACAEAITCTPEDDPAFCARLNAVCGAMSAKDNCGRDRTVADCGTCTGTGESCVANKCTCTPTTDDALCAEAHADCGALTVTDNCGQERAIANCGTCQGVENVCNTTTHKCSCTADSDAAVCSKTNDAKCGPLVAFDNCGARRTIASCGTCSGTGESCENNQCLCHPETDLQLCADVSAVCGSITVTDNCGAERTVACGSCRSFEACEANQCVCHPVTDLQLCAATNNATCGTVTATDNCGASRTVASCGACTGTGEACENNHCACHPKSDAQLCTERNANCGAVSVTDNCGATRSVTCGTCAGTGQTCEANRCTCAPMTDAQLCAATGNADCGALTAIDNCGAPRTVTSCGTCTGTGQSCTANHCLCSPKNDVQLCAENSLHCGTTSLTDNCGATRSVGCGTCGGTGEVCTANQCVCTPKTDVQLCADASNADCGSLSVTDNCGVARTVASCGTCSGTGVTCNSNHCGCIAKTDLQLCAAAGAACGSITATDNCGASRTISNCGTCALPGTCNTTRHLCQVPGVLLNDGCAGAEPLVFDSNGLATATGDTSRATDSGGAKNLSSGGPDVVYSMTLTQPKGVNLTLNAFGSAVLYVRSSCSDNLTDLRCYGSGQLTTAPISLPRLEPGTYYVWVDSTSVLIGGTFVLTAQLKAPAAAPVNDSCTAAIPITLTNGYAAVLGSTESAADNYRGTCDATAAGGDLVYSLTLPADASVVAKVSRGAAALTTFYPSVYLRSVCASAAAADEKGCSAPKSSSTPASVTSALTAGTYYIIVDGTTSSGPFTLEVNTGPMTTNQSCTSAMPLLFDGNGVAAISGDNTFGTSSQSSSTAGCSSSGKELVYSFAIPQAYNVEAIVTPLSSGGQPGVYLRSTCATSSTQKTCATATAPGKTVRATAANLAAGTYYVIVDSNSSTATQQGPFNLEVRLSPTTPVPNAVCGGAIPLAFNYANRAVISATTANSANTTSSNAPCLSQAGPELIYSFTLVNPAAVSAKVTRADTDPTFYPSIYIRSACTDPTSAAQVGCSAGASSSQAFSWFNAPSLAAGTYYVFVDSAAATSVGWFNLEIAQSPVRTNDTCTSPTPLTFDGNGVATVSDDTSFAANDLAVSSTTGCGTNSAGGDLVYSFTTSTAKDVVVQVTPAAGQTTRHTVYLRSDCTSNTFPTSEIACANAAAAGDTIKLINRRLAAGTWYVIVDGYGGAPSYENGPFTLKVTATDPAAAPANDTCAGTVPTLTFDPVTGHAIVTGSTFAATDDLNGTTGTCLQTPSGGDVVYTFTLAADAWVEGKAMRDATDTFFRPMVYVRGPTAATCTSAAPADQKACGTSNLSGVATFTSTLLSAGTYFVIVDGMLNNFAADLNPQGSFGNFTLDVWQRPVNSCTSPTDLVFDGNGFATVVDDTTLQPTKTLSTSSACGSGSGKELVYRFTTTATQDIDLQLTEPVGAMYRRSVYLRTACATATETACSYTSQYGGLVALKARLPANTYFLIVDGYSSSGDDGAFTMTVKLTDSPTAPPANDTCAGAIALGFDGNGRAVANGSTIGAADDYQGVACATSSSGDVVYSFTLTELSGVSVKLTRDISTPAYVPIFYVRSATCTSTLAADEKACITNTSSASISKNFKYLTPGTYYVIADGATGTSGNFGLELQTFPAIQNDTCAGPDFPAPVVVDATGFWSGTGDLSLMDPVNHADGKCNPGSGYDAVYVLTLNQTKTVRVQMEFTGNNTYANVYIRTQCDVKDSEVACAYGPSGTKVTDLMVPLLAPGTYYLWADSYSTSSSYNGPYALRVWVTDPPPPPANSVCAGAIPLVFDGTGKSTTVNGDTTYVASAQSGTCDPGTGGELVYSFTATAAQKVVATAARTSGTTYNPLVYIRSACGSTAASSEVTCAKGSSGTATATVNNLAAGTYFIWVDGIGSYGQFKLDVQLSAPATGPANESCAFTTPITFTAGTASVTGTTLGAVNEAWSNASSCTTTSTPDVVYSFTLAQAQSLNVTVTPANAGATYRPGFMVRKSCGSMAVSDEVFCASAATAAPYLATANYANLAPGTYYLWVDSSNSSFGSGDFTLDLALAAPRMAPANDTCATATPLTFTAGVATATGTIADAMNDTVGSGCSPFVLGPDVYYSFTAPASVNVLVDVTPVDTTGGFKPWVDIRTICASAASADELACGQGSSSPYKASATAALTLGSTYFVVVDTYAATYGTGATAGQFNLTVTALYPPANDTCAGVIPLTLGTPVSGDTTNALNDYTWGTGTNTYCGSPRYSTDGINANDVVYSYTAQAAGPFTVSTTASWDVAFWVGTTTCGDYSTCVIGVDNTTGNETTTITGVAGTTYFVYVDGYNTAKGPFTITVATP